MSFFLFIQIPPLSLMVHCEILGVLVIFGEAERSSQFILACANYDTLHVGGLSS
jgi:hypothetical protein